MASKTKKILIVEDEPSDVERLQDVLTSVQGMQYNLVTVAQLDHALEKIDRDGIDLILLDLNLPDSRGLDTFVRLHTAAPKVPIIVLTGSEEDTLAAEAVRQGAQDYLDKNCLDSRFIARTIHYAIERHRMVALLRGLTLIDELTGLYNRRGFQTLASQNLKLANRNKRKLIAVSANLDDWHSINETYGYPEGDRAIIQTGGVLKETFRETDIVARMGRDRFAVMVLEASEDAADLLTDRLHSNLKRCNIEAQRPYELSLSVGTACYDPSQPCSVEELVHRAYRSMISKRMAKKPASMGTKQS